MATFMEVCLVRPSQDQIRPNRTEPSALHEGSSRLRPLSLSQLAGDARKGRLVLGQAKGKGPEEWTSQPFGLLKSLKQDIFLALGIEPGGKEDKQTPCVKIDHLLEIYPTHVDNPPWTIPPLYRPALHHMDYYITTSQEESSIVSGKTHIHDSVDKKSVTGSPPPPPPTTTTTMCIYYYLHYHHVAPCNKGVEYAVHYAFCANSTMEPMVESPIANHHHHSSSSNSPSSSSGGGVGGGGGGGEYQLVQQPCEFLTRAPEYDPAFGYDYTNPCWTSWADGGPAAAAAAAATPSGGASTPSGKSLIPYAIMSSAGTAGWMSRSRFWR
ncbi:hypothetical protein F5B21DRAFT_527572 [Xylaria acuta]|nr:hypothetical protein F5B21DRAFT_527572 [Xylaria acuta]